MTLALKNLSKNSSSFSASTATNISQFTQFIGDQFIRLWTALQGVQLQQDTSYDHLENDGARCVHNLVNYQTLSLGLVDTNFQSIIWKAQFLGLVDTNFQSIIWKP